jgi:hypothetical protein
MLAPVIDLVIISVASTVCEGGKSHEIAAGAGAGLGDGDGAGDGNGVIKGKFVVKYWP